MRLRLALLVLSSLPFVGPMFPQGSRYERWLKDWETAEQKSDLQAMQRVVKQQPAEAIEYFVAMAWGYSVRLDPPTREKMDRFKDVLNLVYGNTTVADKIQEFFTGLDPTKKKELQPLIASFNGAYSMLEEAKKTRKDEDFLAAHAQAVDAATKLTEMGYNLKAAEAWALASQVLTDKPGATNDDAKKAVEHLEQFKKLREEWGWTKDSHWFGNINFLESEKKRIASGGARAGEPAKNPEGGKEAGKPGEAAGPKHLEGSKWETCPITAKTDTADYEGLTVYSGGYPLSWLSVYVSEKDGSNRGRFEFFKDGNIHVLRKGANKFFAGADDKTAEKDLDELKLKNKPSINTFHYKHAEKPVSYAMWMYVGGEQESHLRLTLNMAPTWEEKRRVAVIFYRSAMAYAATVHGVPIVFNDENCTGIIGEEPDTLMMRDTALSKTLGDPGSHPTMDAMTIGGVRVPFSNFVKLGKDWCQIRVQGNNEAINVRPIDPASAPCGTITLKWNGPAPMKPRSLVVREITGFKGAYFDVMSNPKGVEVPAGEYEVLYGRFVSGKGPTAKSGILLKGESKTYKVEAGKTATIELGAPFAIEFVVKKDGTKATVDGVSTWVKGKAGERYGHVIDEVIEPEVVVSTDNAGKTGKVVGKFKRIANDDLTAAIDNAKKQSGKQEDPIYSTTAPYYPINAAKSGKEATFFVDFDLPTGSFVGLRQKGHKLFGDLNAVFK